jgi:dTDP-4-dehydrorhamnose 3,5-epimerase-like enzyme
MVDLFLDIRKGSPTFGKASAYEIAPRPDESSAEWIWIPPGFAHGNYFSEASTIEYFCSGEYSPGCEAGISPLATDIDWSTCDSVLKKEFDELTQSNALMTEKDINGFTIANWITDERSNQFLYKFLGD